jgi:1-acyl-sn-glycerol-3-phosphate acyltransferase
VLLFPVALVVWAITAPFDRRRVVLHRFTCWWASLYTWVNPLWPVRVEGRERIDSDETYVMVANHLSLLDILVLFRLFRHFKWVSKIENFKVPFIGWNMRLNGYIPLRRGDRASVRQMLAACERDASVRLVDHDVPRGHALDDGRPQRVQAGRVRPRPAHRTPILPIVIEGTHHALPKRGFVLQGRHPSASPSSTRSPPSASTA